MGKQTLISDTQINLVQVYQLVPTLVEVVLKDLLRITLIKYSP